MNNRTMSTATLNLTRGSNIRGGLSLSAIPEPTTSAPPGEIDQSSLKSSESEFVGIRTAF